jgi:hypothetical protein
MKRQTFGGAHRGPVAPTRQRRTIRIMQVIFLLFAIGLFVFAVFSWLDARTYYFSSGPSAYLGDPPQESYGQAVALAVLAAVSLGAALTLRDGRSVRIPTPASLDELAGRAEATALERAQRIAEEQSAELGTETGSQPSE